MVVDACSSCEHSQETDTPWPERETINVGYQLFLKEDHLNTYEDRYLLERMKKIIAAQKEGKILVAAYLDGTCLPTREDLGLEIERPSSPYDYMVGKAGCLTYHAGLSLYIFTTRAGGRLPPVLIIIRPPQLG
jgi:hypothetical protein